MPLCSLYGLISQNIRKRQRLTSIIVNRYQPSTKAIPQSYIYFVELQISTFRAPQQKEFPHCPMLSRFVTQVSVIHFLRIVLGGFAGKKTKLVPEPNTTASPNYTGLQTIDSAAGICATLLATARYTYSHTRGSAYFWRVSAKYLWTALPLSLICMHTLATRYREELAHQLKLTLRDIKCDITGYVVRVSCQPSRWGYSLNPGVKDFKIDEYNAFAAIDASFQDKPVFLYSVQLELLLLYTLYYCTQKWKRIKALGN